jgi:hypothetical protein
MKRYEPVFIIYHKLRAGMGQRYDPLKFEDMAEYGEVYLGKSTKVQIPKIKKR